MNLVDSPGLYATRKKEQFSLAVPSGGRGPMSNLLREEVAQRNLSTIEVATYLRTRGWQRLEHASRDVSYWRRTVAAGGFEVLLPHHHEWTDYLDLLTALADTVARTEGRSALALLRDLTTATCDIVRLRAVTGPASDGTIGVGDGLRLIDCLRRVFLAAACTAVEPRRAAALAALRLPLSTLPIPVGRGGPSATMSVPSRASHCGAEASARL